MIGRRVRRLTVGVTVVVVLAGVGLEIGLRTVPFPWARIDRWSRSVVVTDSAGAVMLARVGADDQRREPIALDDMGAWLGPATIAVEDERFRRHPGVDPIAVVRALGQNVGQGRVVSGASTLTMQVCRMIDDPARTLRAKVIEAFRALQLERAWSKDRILAHYLNTAPYGGNVRGVEAAAHRWFGKRACDLSLGEAALLAGLPQSPSRLRSDRYPERAIARRAVVLDRMRTLGLITPAQAQYANEEPVALAPAAPSPSCGRHAAWMTIAARGAHAASGRIVTTIDGGLQMSVERMTREHAAGFAPGTDVAVVVIDVPDATIVALVGSADPDDHVDGQVNGATARRSPGSTLKPFVYAAAFDARRLGPTSIVPDRAIERGGWSPVNFDGQFLGETTVRTALQRSLNVPAILVTEAMGLERCAGVLESAGVPVGPDAVDRAGLALAVGGIETTLLDLTEAYATIARGGVHMRTRLIAAAPRGSARRAVGASACAALDDVLASHARMPAGMEGLASTRIPWFMWKTGTSSGRRDAWAIGHNGRFAVGVWVGRFDGRGDRSFVGGAASEPLLARIFDLPAVRRTTAPVPASTWPVDRPLRFAVGRADALRITSPGDGVTYLATAPTISIAPRTETERPVTWFLDGRRVELDHDGCLVVGNGIYAIRAVDTRSGTVDTVQFVVRGDP